MRNCSANVIEAYNATYDNAWSNKSLVKFQLTMVRGSTLLHRLIFSQQLLSILAPLLETTNRSLHQFRIVLVEVLHKDCHFLRSIPFK
jgi:hypothetical protein